MDKDLIIRYNTELRLSKPIRFKDINIYPVLFKDYNAYNSYIDCLLYNPIYYNDDALSTLPLLYFITSVLNERDKFTTSEDEQFLFRKSLLLQLFGLLRLVLREQRFEFKKNNSGIYYLSVGAEGKNITINAKEFGEIRKIILTQNNTPYFDEYVHPDILRWIEEQKKRERSNGRQDIIETLEDHIEALMITFQNTDEHFLDNMSIRRVDRLVSKVINRELYNAQMIGSMSGMVKFKEDPVSWVTTKFAQSDFDKYLKELK